MRVQLDEQSDALYLRLDESPIVDSLEVHPGIVLDFDARVEVVGIEILRVKQRLPEANLRELKFDVA